MTEERKEHKRLYNQEYKKRNKERDRILYKIQYSSWYQNNKEHRKEYMSKWYKNNKAWVKKYNYEYAKNREIIDPIFKLKNDIGKLICNSIKRSGYFKSKKSREILGCSIEEFSIHLESKFECWMNWSNRGNWDGIPKEINHSWDIDHIIPLATAKTEEDVIRLNHYTNLRPLCSYTNRYIKGGRYEL